MITASLGNHAQGVAYAAKIMGVKATIVMPEFSPIIKVLATRHYGAKVLLYGRGYEEAYNRATEIQKEKGYTFIHAFDDPQIIAGHGTIGLEILESLPDVHQVVVPVGGGGLISGIAFTIKQLNPEVKIIGVESEKSPSMKVSLERGKMCSIPPETTIADGIAVKTPGKITFQFVKKYVDSIVTVTEEEIAGAILLLLERAKLIAEGAGAAGLAACINQKINCSGKKTAIILSGGNIDTNLISRIIERGLVKEGRYLSIRTIVKDEPGELKNMLSLISKLKANVVTVNHDRIRLDIPVGYARIELLVETWGKEHSDKIISSLKKAGFDVQTPPRL